MKANDNSVNIKTERRGYHHGDLRAALVAAGLELLKQRTADDISLREVARAVGVSATAVYRHFPDKQSLLYALCELGAEALAEAQRAAGEAAGGGQAGFDATGQAYVRFALANPALFRLMMSVQPNRDYFDEEVPAVNSAMQQLRTNIAALLPKDASEEEQRITAIHAWSVVHGMAMLMLDGLIPADETIIASLGRQKSGD